MERAVRRLRQSADAADAIRAAAADFGNCIAGLWPEAARRGITRANFERLTAG